MKRISLFSIKYVAARTGLKPHLIRVWESRYQVVTPRRTDSNHRLYCQTDIHRLVLLKKAVADGHRISRIADLSNEQLEQLVSPARPTSSPAESGRSAETVNSFKNRCWQAVRDLEPDALEDALFQAAVQLSRRALVEQVIVPLFTRIGDAWADGYLKIINEHMATQYTRGLLMDLLRNSSVSQPAPRIVLATPIGQRHELGALCAALAACEAGWRPVYIGADLPADELIAATSHLKAGALALSISNPVKAPVLQTELTRLHRFLNPGVTLLIGGRLAHQFKAAFEPFGVHFVSDWQGFKETLHILSHEPADS